MHVRSGASPLSSEKAGADYYYFYPCVEFTISEQFFCVLLFGGGVKSKNTTRKRVRKLLKKGELSSKKICSGDDIMILIYGIYCMYIKYNIRST